MLASGREEPRSAKVTLAVPRSLKPSEVRGRTGRPTSARRARPEPVKVVSPLARYALIFTLLPEGLR
jgi:hypothetical protein